MSIFGRLERNLSRACDRTFSVSAIIDPMQRTPNGRSQPDPDRAEIHVKGILDQRDEMAAVESGKREGKGNDLHTLVSGSEYQFSVDVNRYPAAKGIRQGDKLTLDDARRFEIVSVQRDGMSRVMFGLVLLPP